MIYFIQINDIVEKMPNDNMIYAISFFGMIFFCLWALFKCLNKTKNHKFKNKNYGIWGILSTLCECIIFIMALAVVWLHGADIIRMLGNK